MVRGKSAHATSSPGADVCLAVTVLDGIVVTHVRMT
jgi:hypothetical protein